LIKILAGVVRTSVNGYPLIGFRAKSDSQFQKHCHALPNPTPIKLGNIATEIQKLPAKKSILLPSYQLLRGHKILITFCL
jgi:hypothetical protein